MREQRGYVFHEGKSWFVRYCDDIMQVDGTSKRKQVCKRLSVEYGGDYIKSINESQVNALDALTEKFETCNDFATNATRTIQ